MQISSPNASYFSLSGHALTVEFTGEDCFKAWVVKFIAMFQ